MIETELGEIERERSRYVSAVGAGGDIPALVEALRAREVQIATLKADLHAIAAPTPKLKPEQSESPNHGVTSVVRTRRR